MNPFSIIQANSKNPDMNWPATAKWTCIPRNANKPINKKACVVTSMAKKLRKKMPYSHKETRNRDGFVSAGTEQTCV